MAKQAPVDWPSCSQDGCIGIRLDAGGRCLAHAAADERKAELKRIGETGEIDMRGVPITKELLDRVMAAVQRDANEQPLLTGSRFGRATFKGDAWFLGPTFEGDAEFDGATFEGDADFQAAFKSDARFVGATFRRGAGFDQAAFEGDAGFNKAIFEGDTGFNKTIFRGLARFPGATFRGDTEFEELPSRARPGSWRRPSRASPDLAGRSSRVPPGSTRRPSEATPTSGRRPSEATPVSMMSNFGTPHLSKACASTGPCSSARCWPAMYWFLMMCGSRSRPASKPALPQSPAVEQGFPPACASGCDGPVWCWDDTDFPAPSILTGVPRLASDDLAEREDRIAKAWQRRSAGEISERPRLLSLQRANVTGLGLTTSRWPTAASPGRTTSTSFAWKPTSASQLPRVGWAG
jgi:hypothetical protein